MTIVGPRLLVGGILIACLCLFPSGASPQQPAGGRPKIGLVLSGGGARGAAHIGVLRVLEELRVPVDFVAGTSMGAVIGGLYASGMSPDEIESAVTVIDWNDVFVDAPPREEREWRRKYDDGSFLVEFELGLRNGRFLLPKGFLTGQKLSLILNRLTLPVTHVSDFDALPIPFRAVATNVGNGEAVVLSGGKLFEAMRASMAVPGAFTPYEIDGRILADGGLVNNLPIDVARQMGADLIIAVEVSSPYSDPEELASILEISEQLVKMITRVNTDAMLEDLGPEDILILPDLGELGPADFPAVWEGIAAGEAGARKAAEALRGLSLPPENYRNHRASQRAPAWNPPMVHAILLDNESTVSDEIIRARMRLLPGTRLHPAPLERDISRIFGLGEFEEVAYYLDHGATGDSLYLRLREKSWGPNYIRFGLAMSDDSNANSLHTLRISHVRTQVNRLGGEWKNQLWMGSDRRLTTEFYQPLDYAGRIFLSAETGVRESTTRLNLTGSVSTYRIRAVSTEFAAGLRLGTLGQFKAGLRFADSDARVTTGEADVEKLDAADGGLFGELVLDTYGNVNFPEAGGHLEILYRRVVDGLAADQSYHRLDVGLARAATHRGNTLLSTVRLGSSFGTELATFDRFALGGFGNLSGYERGEIVGSRYGLLALRFYRAVTGLPESPLGSALYLGASLSTGNAWAPGEALRWEGQAFGGSLFLGLDTLLGPIYLAQGFGDGGRRISYFYLGRAF